MIELEKAKASLAEVYEIADIVVPGYDNYFTNPRGNHTFRFGPELRVYREAIAPSGATFVTRRGSRWTGDYLLAALRGQQLRRLTFDGDRVVGSRGPDGDE